MWYTRMRLGEFDPPELNPYTTISIDVIQSESHRLLATEAAKMSFVLLKNEKNLLPIKQKLKKVTVSCTISSRKCRIRLNLQRKQVFSYRNFFCLLRHNDVICFQLVGPMCNNSEALRGLSASNLNVNYTKSPWDGLQQLGTKHKDPRLQRYFCSLFEFLFFLLLVFHVDFYEVPFN